MPRQVQLRRTQALFRRGSRALQPALPRATGFPMGQLLLSQAAQQAAVPRQTPQPRQGALGL